MNFHIIQTLFFFFFYIILPIASLNFCILKTFLALAKTNQKQQQNQNRIKEVT